MKDILSRLLHSEKFWVAVAYVAFFAIFWFLGRPQHKMGPTTAYAAVVLFHGFFYLAYRFYKKITEKS